jgi:hypothetical protein
MNQRSELLVGICVALLIWAPSAAAEQAVPPSAMSNAELDQH